MDCASRGYGESWGSSRCCWSTWTPGCCLSPFQHIPAASAPASPCSSAPQGQLRAAAISTLGSPGLPLPGRPDADQAGRASINYSSAEHRRQQGRHQLLQQSMGDPWPNPTGTKPALAQSQQARDLPVPAVLPARDAGSGSAQDELHTHPKIAAR